MITKRQHIDIGTIRREQIVEAAIAAITQRGLENVSLSEIEKRAGMSRGQLTYYFPAKEDILLAVFDRLVVLMHERVGAPAGPGRDEAGGWDLIRHLLEKLLTKPPVSAEFGCLQYTFLAQMGRREDFRRRLAGLYEGWRSNLALGLAADMVSERPVRAASPRALATLVQALIHGLVMQRAVDPQAFKSQEMVDLCLDLLATFVWGRPRTRQKQARSKANKQGANLRRRPGKNGVRSFFSQPSDPGRSARLRKK
jgi:AcrR family transcriptional regulator